VAIEGASYIAGIGSFLPERVVSSREIEERLGFREKLRLPLGTLERLTGIRERRHVDPGVGPSDLSAQAGKRALADAGLAPRDVEVLIFAACSHDVGEPATANIVQEKLGAANAQVFDVKNACNSFLNALNVLDAFIATGRCRVGLVVSGEVNSCYVDWEVAHREDLERKLAGLTLGDGAGAAVVLPVNGDGRRLVASEFLSRGTEWRLAVVEGCGSLHTREMDKTFLYSDSAEIQRLALLECPPQMRRVLSESGWAPEDVDLVVPHQVTVDIARKVAEQVGVPYERWVITVDRYGNTAAASIPIALCEARNQGRLKPGSKVLLAGGASGFSAGAITLVW